MNSHRQIFHSSAITGGATGINIVIGIIKVKVLAVLLGPAGIGLMGLYQNIMSMSSTIAGCGLQSSGVRQLAAFEGEEATLAIVRRTLWLASLILGLIGMVVLWFLREPVAELVFGDAIHADEVGWLGLGLLLTLIAGSQTALLQGLRRIGDLARVTIIGAFFGSITGVLLVYLLGEDGVIWFIITAPAINVLAAMYYASRLPRSKTSCDLRTILQQWKTMNKIGIPLMAASLMTICSLLIAQSLIARDLGLESAGYFQAAWMISMTYIGFVLSAMSVDYFPRLTAAIKDRQRAIKLVNEQTEMTLLLAGPLLLAMLTLAPWIVHLLFTESFAPAIEVLRWQVMGDIFKLIGWPLTFIIVAQGRGTLYTATQLNWNAIYLLCLWYGLEEMGLLVAGIGFFIACVAQVGLVFFLAGKLIGFTAMRRNLWHFCFLLLMGVLILFLTGVSIISAYVVGLIATLIASIYSVRRLNHLMDLFAWLKRKIGNKPSL